MAHHETWKEWDAKLRSSPMGKENPGINALCDYYEKLWSQDVNTIMPVTKEGESHD